MKNFKARDRVRITQDYTWGQGAIGTIDTGVPNIVEGVKGNIYCYSVRFDIPQIDADGDGPYVLATIESDYLELLDE